MSAKPACAGKNAGGIPEYDWKDRYDESVKQKLRYVAYVMLRSAANERM